LVGFGIPDGPFRKKQTAFKWNAFAILFKNSDFRKAAYGYFGHMWELYAFWAFLPVLIHYYNTTNTAKLDVALWSFIGISVGAVSCAVGGYMSLKWGSKKVAAIALIVSGICCLCSPIVVMLSPIFFIALLLFWGAAVVADSPQFSRMVASNTTPSTRGSALTLVNCIGFAISVVSIQIVGYLPELFLAKYGFLLLALGPFFGLWKLGIFRSKSSKNAHK